MLSPVRLSVVCNVRAPYSGSWNFRQYFYGIRYLGHPLTSTENFTEIVPGEPLAGWVKHKRGSQIAILDLSTAISRKHCKIGRKLVLITNRKSYMSFRLVSKSVTLNGVMALFCVISANLGSFWAHYIKVHFCYLVCWWVLVINGNSCPAVVVLLMAVCIRTRLMWSTVLMGQWWTIVRPDTWSFFRTSPMAKKLTLWLCRTYQQWYVFDHILNFYMIMFCDIFVFLSAFLD